MPCGTSLPSHSVVRMSVASASLVVEASSARGLQLLVYESGVRGLKLRVYESGKCVASS